MANCACGNWLKHWERFSSVKSPCCAADGCNLPATNGAHIQKAESEDMDWYVIPLCKQHGENEQELIIDDEHKLVSANVSLTCERW